MSLNINHYPTVNVYELEELFEETYGYRISIHETFFNFEDTQDCYKDFNLSWSEDDWKNNDGNLIWEDVFNNIRLTNLITKEYDDDYNNYELDLARLIKLLRDQGITEDKVLIDFS